MTERPTRPRIGLTGLLNLVALVEQKRTVRASRDAQGGVLCPRSQPSEFPPPAIKDQLSRWEQLPQANRQRLLWLLSQLLERQLGPSVPRREVSDDAAVSGR